MLIQFSEKEKLLLRSCLLSSTYQACDPVVPVEDIPLTIQASALMGEAPGTPEAAALIMGQTSIGLQIWERAVDMFDRARARATATIDSSVSTRPQPSGAQ